MNNSETTDREYIHLMIDLIFDSVYFDDIIGEFHFQLKQGETRRMAMVLALNNFDLIGS